MFPTRIQGTQGIQAQLQRDGMIDLGVSAQYPGIADLFIAAQSALHDPAMAEVFAEWSKQWSCELGTALPRGLQPRLRNRKLTDPRGHKTAVQVPQGLFWIARQHRTSGVSLPLLRLLGELEVRLREAATTFRTLLPLNHTPTTVTARVIGYRKGPQLGQGWHTDPSIATIIHRGPSDTRLVVDGTVSRGTGILVAPSLPGPSAIMITGDGCGSVLPGTEPLRHAVLPIDDDDLRISVTFFLWKAPIAWAGPLGLAPNWEADLAA